MSSRWIFLSVDRPVSRLGYGRLTRIRFKRLKFRYNDNLLLFHDFERNPVETDRTVGYPVLFPTFCFRDQHKRFVIRYQTIFYRTKFEIISDEHRNRILTGGVSFILIRTFNIVLDFDIVIFHIVTLYKMIYYHLSRCEVLFKMFCRHVHFRYETNTSTYRARHIIICLYASIAGIITSKLNVL